jgi:hypothetical protein
MTNNKEIPYTDSKIIKHRSREREREIDKKICTIQIIIYILKMSFNN